MRPAVPWWRLAIASKRGDLGDSWILSGRMRRIKTTSVSSSLASLISFRKRFPGRELRLVHYHQGAAHERLTSISCHRWSHGPTGGLCSLICLFEMTGCAQVGSDDVMLWVAGLDCPTDSGLLTYPTILRETWRRESIAHSNAASASRFCAVLRITPLPF